MARSHRDRRPSRAWEKHARRDRHGTFSFISAEYPSGGKEEKEEDAVLTKQLLLFLAATVVRGLYRGVVVAQHRVLHDARRLSSGYVVAGHRSGGGARATRELRPDNDGDRSLIITHRVLPSTRYERTHVAHTHADARSTHLSRLGNCATSGTLCALRYCDPPDWKIRRDGRPRHNTLLWTVCFALAGKTAPTALRRDAI